MQAEKANHRVATMCRVLDVSKSGFYAWRTRRRSKRAREDDRLTELISRIHRSSRETYGAPRVHAELRIDHGIFCGKKRIARLMKAAGLEGCHRRRRHSLTRRSATGRGAPDLVERNFTASGPDRLWVADITYVPTQRGFVYLAAVLDVFSRRVVGWSLRRDITAELVLGALDMAILNRGPRPGLIHHSDHGSQFTSVALGRRLEEAQILASMGTTGDCYDNALIESFFATLECELIDRYRFRDKEEASIAVFEFIEGFYNPMRRHSSLDYLSPTDYERRYNEQLPEPLAHVH